MAGPAPGPTRGATVNALDDGRILVFGGGRAKIWNPGTRRWDEDRSAPHQPRRSRHTATQATDGRIVMIGGLDSDSFHRHQQNALGSTTVWRPVANVWEAGPGLLTARIAHAAVALPSNEILVIGGSSSAYGDRAFAPFLASVELVGDKTTTLRAPMTEPRAYHTASLLHDGRVMVVGGSASDGKPLASVEIYDPQKNTWVEGPPLSTARSGHTASVLPDGSVLVVGGVDAEGNTIALAERWLASSNTWSPAGMLAEARAEHQATVLSTGDVLISGGIRHRGGTQPGLPALSLELWRATRSRWTTAGSMPLTLRDHLAFRGAHDAVFLFGSDSYASASLVWLPDERENATIEDAVDATLTQLSDGRFLLAGGNRRQAPTAAAFVYDPDADRWTSTSPMHWARSSHRALLMRDGRVLVFGGTIHGRTRPSDSGQRKATYPAEIWDPKTGNWSLLATLEYKSGEFAEPALLPDGRVVLGVVDNRYLQSEAVHLFRIWNPRDDSLTLLTKVPRTRPGGHALYFPDGHLLYAGGHDQTLFRNSPQCIGDAESEEEVESADDQEPALYTSDPCVITSESAREGRRLDWWDPTTRSWREMPPAEVSLNGLYMYPLQDGGVFAWQRPASRHGITEPPAPISRSALVWQPVYGWRTLPLPTEVSKGAFPQPMVLPKGELLVRADNAHSWLWSPPAGKWLAIAHEVTWGFVRGTYRTKNGEVIAFRTRAPSEAGFPKLEVTQLNRRTLRWEPVGEGYIPRRHPAVIALRDGRVMVAGGDSAITQIWNPKNNAWWMAGYTNAVLRAPQGLLLEDGGVMLVGAVNNDQTLVACELWRPKAGRWESCGRFQSDARDSRHHMVLRYLDDDQVLWIYGRQRAMVRKPDGEWIATRLTLPKNGRIPSPAAQGTPFLNPIASVWNPASNRWEDAADALFFNELGMAGYRDAAGSVTALSGNAGRILKWDAGAKTLTALNLEPRERDLRLDAMAPTADGCFIAWSNRAESRYTRVPQALLGNAGTRTWMHPPQALRLPANARAAVASDGTVLMAGYSREAFGRGSASLRLHANCSGIESVDPAAALYLPIRDVPVEVSPPAQARAQHIPLPPKPRPGLIEQWRGEWAAHWRSLHEHLRLKLFLGALIAYLSLRFLVNRMGAYGSDEHVRSVAVKVDIAVIAAALPILIIVLGIPVSLVQAIAGIAVSILGLASARRLWDHAEKVRHKVAFGASYAVTAAAAVLVLGMYAGEELTRLVTFLTDYS